MTNADFSVLVAIYLAVVALGMCAAPYFMLSLPPWRHPWNDLSRHRAPDSEPGR